MLYSCLKNILSEEISMSTPINLSAASQVVHPQLSEPLQGSQTILQGADENKVPQPLGQEQNDALANPLIVGARDLEEKGKLIDAEKLYIMALQFTSKSEDYAHLPRLFEKKGEKERAASAYVILADLQLNEGKQAETIATLKKSLELASHPAIKEKLGNVLNSHGQKQEAAILFLELAQQALYNKDNLNAIRLGRLALETFPGHAEAWKTMADMQQEPSETLKMLLNGANEPSMPIKERMELCRMVSIKEPEHLQAKLLFLELNQVKMKDKIKRLKQEPNEKLSTELQQTNKEFRQLDEQIKAQAAALVQTNERLSTELQQTNKELRQLKEQIKAQAVAPVQIIKTPTLPAWVFGAAEWNKYFGDVGVEPPLPNDIVQRLPELRANNVLVLIPATVNGQPLTLKTVGELVQKPLQGHATKYSGCYSGEYVDQPAKSHWALLTRTLIDGSRNKLLKDEQVILESYSQKTKIRYEVPTILDATVCNFMEYVRSGTWLYSGGTYTWCQEKYNADANYTLIVGDGSAVGLYISYINDARESSGVGGLRKSF